jgi:hypothetical protein
MELEGSLPCLQKHTLGPHLYLVKSSLHAYTVFVYDWFEYYSPIDSDIPSDLFHSGFLIKILYAYLM